MFQAIDVVFDLVKFSDEDKMTIITIDYNGTGRWSLQAVQQRYIAYAHSLKVSQLLSLTPQMHEHNQRRWIYPVMDKVIKGIEQGDLACIEIGVEFIEEDERMPFGKIMKSNTARALRRTVLTLQQVERIRLRVVCMLIAEHVPHEYHEYAKLLRKVGLGNWWSFIEEQANRDNPYVLRYYKYFQQYVRPQ